MTRVLLVRRRRPQILPDGSVQGTLRDIARRPRWFWRIWGGQLSDPTLGARYLGTVELGPIRIIMVRSKQRLPLNSPTDF